MTLSEHFIVCLQSCCLTRELMFMPATLPTRSDSETRQRLSSVFIYPPVSQDRSRNTNVYVGDLVSSPSRRPPQARSYHRSIAEHWKDDLRVVMVSTRNPSNIGAAARAMANFGFASLRVVQPYDVAFREARSAVGAAPLLQTAEEFAGRGRGGGGLPAGGRHHLGRPSRTAASHPPARIRFAPDLQALAAAPVALLFGSEKYGLSNEDLSHCHWLMRIPTVDADLSMNLGQAVALCLYELARDSKAAGAGPERSAVPPPRKLEQITTRLLDVLRRSGYINPVTSASTEEKIRRLVRRLGYCGPGRSGAAGDAAADFWKIG